MSRPMRLALPGGVFHVISRGNDRQVIFSDPRDRRLFLEVLAHTVERYGWLCHTYCLMDDHYHLLLETSKANLSLGMRQLNGLYARRFNVRHARCGHLFQARFRSILVEKESHLLAASRYIVLNPVRARLCTSADGWRWSSYRALAGVGPVEGFLCTHFLLSHFGETRRSAHAAYRKFVDAGLGEMLEEQVRGERLGGTQSLRERFGLDPPVPEIPRVQIEPLRPPLAEIFAAKTQPVAVAHCEYGYTLREIADHLGCHYSTISRRLRREEQAVLQCKT